MLFPVKQEPENRTPEGAEPGHWGFSPCSTWAVPGVMPEQEQPPFLTTSLRTRGTETPSKALGAKSCPARGTRETRGAEPDPTATGPCAEKPDNLITSEMLQVLSSPACPALLPALSCLSALLSPQLCFSKPNDSLIPRALSHRS